jgi:large subunit ribosomal protein L13
MNSGTPTVRAADIRHEWFVVDASDQVLGRLASDVARVLAGKHRPGWVSHLDTGDFVVVTNAEKVKLTGRKEEEKVYHRHSGYPGGLKSVGASEMRAKYPERLVEQAVRGMLPKTKLGRRQLKKLKVYRGSKHPHQAQQPTPLARGRRSAKISPKAAAPAAKA